MRGFAEKVWVIRPALAVVFCHLSAASDPGNFYLMQYFLTAESVAFSNEGGFK